MIVADTPLRRCLRRLPGARMKRAATSDNVDGGAWNAAAPLCATRAYCLFNCVQLEHTDHFGPLHRSHHTRTDTRTHTIPHCPRQDPSLSASCTLRTSQRRNRRRALGTRE